MGLNIEALKMHGIECEDEDKISAWSKIDSGVETIAIAVEDRLEGLDYDADEYVRGSNAEIDELLAVYSYLRKISEASSRQCAKRRGE